MITKHEWIISTLRTLNEQDPEAIGLTEKHFQVLEQQLYIDPHSEVTPYQKIVSKYQREQ